MGKVHRTNSPKEVDPVIQKIEYRFRDLKIIAPPLPPFSERRAIVVDLFERYVVKRDRLGFLELHLAALPGRSNSRN